MLPGRPAVLRCVMLKALKAAPTPPPSPADVMARLPKPPELVDVEQQLAEARDRRERLRSELSRLATANARDADVQRERTMRDIARDMDDAEQQITTLRRRRSALRQPLATEAGAALQPVVLEAAARILEGLATVDAGLERLRQVALEVRPFDIGGLHVSTLPSGLSVERLAALSTRDLTQLGNFAKRLRGEIA